MPDLAVYGTFVFGYDDDSLDTIKRSVEFACEQKLFLAAFNQLIPFPGTPLYRRLLAEGRLIKVTWWLDHDCWVGDVVFRPARMQPGELQQACLDARHDFFKTGAIVQRMTDFGRESSHPFDGRDLSWFELAGKIRHRLTTRDAFGCRPPGRRTVFAGK